MRLKLGRTPQCVLPLPPLAIVGCVLARTARPNRVAVRAMVRGEHAPYPLILEKGPANERTGA